MGLNCFVSQAFMCCIINELKDENRTLHDLSMFVNPGVVFLFIYFTLHNVPSNTSVFCVWVVRWFDREPF